MDNEDQVPGWWIFAAVLLAIGGTLNVIWGIAAIDEAHFVTVTGSVYLFSSLNTWGWITLVLWDPRAGCSPVAVRRGLLRAVVRDLRRSARGDRSAR